MKRQLTWALVSISLIWSATLQAALPEFTQLVKKSSPAVVNISAQRPSPGAYHEGPGEQEVPEIFKRFFREYEREPRPSTGSGFIISEDGYILTNNHVIDGADEIIVALSDRSELEAEVIGVDPLSDLALLKIKRDGLPVLTMGSSEKLEVGEWVVAIGSPFGFEYSVTAGIVSAKGRSLPDASNNYVPFIQTDVAINPGNSGGPLFNLKGEVIGINSQIFTRSGGFMGLSFAIPIDVAMEVVAQLKDKGSVSRGWLGVLIQQVDRDLAESFGLDKPSGALVSDVFSDSPAEAAGLQEGDIIIAFNGRHIDLSAELPHMVGRTPAGTEVEIKIVRKGKSKTLKLTIGELPETAAQNMSPGVDERNEGVLGLEVEELSDRDKTQLDVDHGVLVSRVLRGPAQEAGIRRGDVIKIFDFEKVTSVAQFRELVERLAGESRAVPVQIQRGGNSTFLSIKIGDD